MSAYGYTHRQADMILNVSRTPGRWFEFDPSYKRTARSLFRRGIIEYQPTETGLRARIKQHEGSA